MPHVGTLDVDLTLDAEALGDGEYAQLVESLLRTRLPPARAPAPLSARAHRARSATAEPTSMSSSTS